jgi:hypothetical protein
LIFTPSIEELGAPKVYRQPGPVPPPALTLVATARAVIVSLFTPKMVMKYVG